MQDSKENLQGGLKWLVMLSDLGKCVEGVERLGEFWNVCGRFGYFCPGEGEGPEGSK